MLTLLRTVVNGRVHFTFAFWPETLIFKLVVTIVCGKTMKAAYLV